MKNWKNLITGLFVVCLLSAVPWSYSKAEENEYYEEEYQEDDYEDQEEEDPIPESYYYPIESNQIAGWPQGPAIEAAAGAVMDMDTGTFLYSKNAQATMYPASITKIMTVLLMVENCNLDEEITFSEIVYNLEEGSSHLGIQPGETMTLRDAAYGIMLASANDMANGVAEYMAGSISGFADMMNQRASELGCVNTHFANPHGLYQDDHYTCAYDMALIARAAYQNPAFKRIVTAREYTIPATNLTEEERSFVNHQKMMQPYEEYYQDWCTGGKTGFTMACLNTLVTYAEKDGRNLVSVILRVNGAGKAYNESTQIIEYGFDNFYTEKTESSDSKLSFYDIMGLHYLGEASEFQSGVWQRSPVRYSSVMVTLPDGADMSDLAYTLTQNKNETVISYEYNGHPVGTSKGSFGTIFAPAQILYAKEREVLPVTAARTETPVQLEGWEEVLQQTVEVLETGYRMFREYAETHFITVLLIGIVVLLILLIFIIILIFRGTAESRIRRRREQEELERRRREEEIERMTTAEIEAELRAVMEQERLRREQEEAEAAEAKAAEAETAESGTTESEAAEMTERAEKGNKENGDPAAGEDAEQ